jgi:hypothetical protein
MNTHYHSPHADKIKNTTDHFCNSPGFISGCSTVRLFRDAEVIGWAEACMGVIP